MLNHILRRIDSLMDWFVDTTIGMITFWAILGGILVGWVGWSFWAFGSEGLTWAIIGLAIGLLVTNR